MTSVLRTPAGILGVALTGGFVILATLAHVVAPADPFASVGSPLTPPSRAHTFGTDDLGRDIFSGIVHGTRTSLTVTLAVIVIASVLGVGVGAVAGYRGGNVDDLLMRGTEAVQILVAERPDVAFIDIGLPVMDGYDVARAARRQGDRGTLLVALTGYGQAEDRQRCFDAEFDDFVLKPVDPARLRQILAERTATLQ